MCARVPLQSGADDGTGFGSVPSASYACQSAISFPSSQEYARLNGRYQPPFLPLLGRSALIRSAITNRVLAHLTSPQRVSIAPLPLPLLPPRLPLLPPPRLLNLITLPLSAFLLPIPPPPPPSHLPAISLPNPIILLRIVLRLIHIAPTLADLILDGRGGMGAPAVGARRRLHGGGCIRHARFLVGRCRWVVVGGGAGDVEGFEGEGV